MAAADALGDAGVLAPEPTLEFGQSRAVGLVGGTAVLAWRGAWLRARAAGVACVGDASDVADASFAQAVVHVAKGREATLADAANAWRALAMGGRLVVCGDNALGAATMIGRLASTLGQEPRPLAQRAHGRIAAFMRDARALTTPPARAVPLAPPALAEAFGGAVTLDAPPGVFSADDLDAGTAALLAALARRDEAPRRALDLGCGAGHLAIAALRRWPQARAALADGDRRAVAAAAANLARLGLAARADVAWWDASEPAPADGCDLVLLNPPFHAGVAVDYAPALAMFRAAAAASAARSTWLVVANRRLPYETGLARHGSVRPLAEGGGYKVLEVRRG